jgi:hypothetical protein
MPTCCPLGIRPSASPCGVLGAAPSARSVGPIATLLERARPAAAVSSRPSLPQLWSAAHHPVPGNAVAPACSSSPLETRIVANVWSALMHCAGAWALMLASLNEQRGEVGPGIDRRGVGPPRVRFGLPAPSQVDEGVPPGRQPEHYVVAQSAAGDGAACRAGERVIWVADLPAQLALEVLAVLLRNRLPWLRWQSIHARRISRIRHAAFLLSAGKRDDRPRLRPWAAPASARRVWARTPASWAPGYARRR